MKTGKVLSKKGMKNKIWLVLRQAAILRDGGKCQICYKKADLQVDHCFTRAIGRLHFDLSNLTTLCAKCHTSKSLRKGGPVDKQVDEIVRRREGNDWWTWALGESWKTCPECSRVWFLEEKFIYATEKLEFYKKRWAA